jgi:hypothetical protein
MKIILILLGMLLVCGLSGVLLIFAFRANGNLKKLALHIGYAYTLVAFYLFYMQFNSAVTAVIFTLAFPLLLAAVSLLARRLRLRFGTGVALQTTSGGGVGAGSEFFYPLVVSLVVVLLAAWPYLFSGFGNYWHSANEDIEDGLSGRDSYVNNLIADTPPITIGKIIGIKSWNDFGEVSAPAVKKRDYPANQYLGEVPTPLPKKEYQTSQYKEWYAEGVFRFQYSSLAFWSVLFDERHGVDAFLLQELLCLILMTAGIFFLSRQAFSMAPVASALAAGMSTGSSFYMTSYFAGHEGSLIYGALAPALFFLTLVKDDARRSITGELVFGALITGAIVFSYPHPLALIAAPLFLYWFFCLESVRSRIPAVQSAIKRNPAITLAGVIILAAAIFLTLAELWSLTEYVRLRQDGQYRTWGYTHDWVIVPLFLGLIPAPGQGVLFIGNIIGKPAYFGLLLIALLFAFILIVSYFKARPSKNSDFFLVFGAFWVIECFIFIYFIIDSYYIYKFLYIHQFIIVIGIAAYVSRTQSRSIKLLCAVIVMANLASDLAWGYIIFHRPFNRNTGSLASQPPLDHALLAKSFLTPYSADAIAVRQTLKTNGIHTMPDPKDADYFIVPKGREPDITSSQLAETMGEIAGYSIKRAPANNCLWISTYDEPEQFPGDPVLKNAVFRWVGHRRHDNLSIFVFRPSAPEEMKGRYLRACFQKGPSAQEAINITVSASGKDVLSKFRLEGGGVHCEWIPAEQVVSAGQVSFKTGAIGESLLPYDDRILMFRVFAVGWTDRIYDERTIPFFNTAPDIIKNGSKKAEAGSTPDVTINMGQGWEAYESFGGANFRWGGHSTEIVLTGGGKDGVANVVVDLEPGPSHGKKVFQLEVWDRAGNLLFTAAPITGRNKVVLPLSYNKQKTSVYVLKANSINLPLAGDSRILDYRVFSIALQ